jgi:hypothetical protein
MDNRRTGVPFQAGARNVALLCSVQIYTVSYPSCYSIGYQGFVPWDIMAEA